MPALIWASLSRRWGRAALTALGVCVGVTAIVGLLALTGGLERSAGDLAKLGRADFAVFQAGLADLSASSLPAAVVPRIRRIAGVAEAAPIQIVANAVAGDSSLLVFGSEPSSFLTRRLVIVSGRAATGAQLMVGVGAAARLHVGTGGVVAIAGQRFPVAGVYRSGTSLEDNGLVLPLAVTQRFAGRAGAVSVVAVSIAPGYAETAVESSIQRSVPGTLALGAPGEVARVDTNSRVIQKAAIVIAALALLVGAVVVANTMAMAVMQRQSEFGLLAAVGWRRVDIAALIVGEGLVVSAVGTAAGLALGALAGEGLVRALAAATFVSPNLTAWVLVRGLLVGVGLGVIGALAAIAQVVRVPPLKALGRS
jgi:putative ABC transport system permease protein